MAERSEQSSGRADETFIGPRRHTRLRAESVIMRLIATCGIIGIAVGLAAILAWQDVAGWLIGLVVSVLSVCLAAVLWSSRRL
jgi:hypothetical protein